MSTHVPAGYKWWTGGKSPYNVSYGKLMMWLFLLSDTFTFGALLISYGTIMDVRYNVMTHWTNARLAYKRA